MSIYLIIFQLLFFLLVAPFSIGLVKWFKCQLQNRQGPSILQPYRDLRKLFSKEIKIASNATIIFRFTPYLIFSISILICAIVPLFFINLPSITIADVIVITGLFALSRFFLALAGLDVGTAFGGMGSSREMMIAAIAEPALLMVFFTLAMTASSTNLGSISTYLLNNPNYLNPSLIFSGVGFTLIAIAETGRIPVDNPETHLELTMIHEAMILEYSGKHLALIEWASQLKFMLYCVLLIDLFFPWGIANDFTWDDILISILALLGKLLLLCLALAFAETNLAKFRLFRVPYLLNIAFLLSLLGVLSHIII